MKSSRLTREFLLLLLALVAGYSLVQARGFGSGVGSGKQRDRRPPNFFVLLIDDLDVDLLREPVLDDYPTLRALRDRSLVFENTFVTTPLCGPMRSAFFRGQYGHRTGVILNAEGEWGILDEPSGGYNVFFERGYDGENLAPVLDGLGYRTLLVGKYIYANFPGPAGNGFVPAGWDEFYASRGGQYFESNRYINGVSSTTSASQYRTDVERDDALALLRATGDEPWFLFVAPLAVHLQSDSAPMYAPRHDDLFEDREVPQDPDWLVPDEWGLLGVPSAYAIDRIQAEYRGRLRALMAIDEMLDRILAEIRSRGDSRRTYVIVSSDNGYLLGQHRHKGKTMPWDRSVRVPLWVAGPGVVPGSTDRLVTTADLAPTLIRLAGGAVPPYMDGRSLQPVMREPDLPASDWRNYVVAEGSRWYQSAPAIPFNTVHNAQWTAVITETNKYAEFTDGRFMFHDLEIDPYELAPSALSGAERAAWQTRLALFEQCRSGGCRESEPETSISTPQQSILPATGGFVVHGAAGSGQDQDVAEVRLTIKNLDTDRYWDGGAWVMTPVETLAAVTEVAEGFATWEYAFAGSAGEGESLEVLATASTDQGGTDPTPAVGGFSFGDGAGDLPETTVVLPFNRRVGPAKIGGWVVDRSGIVDVELLHNGVPVTTTLGPATRGELLRTWTADVDFVLGLNEFSAAGIDRTGAVDPTPAFEAFTLD